MQYSLEFVIIMDIVCSTDRVYLKYCITMLLSFFDHHRKERVCVHLLSNGLQTEEVDKVRVLVEGFKARLEVYTVDGGFLDSLTQGRQSYISSTTYARLFLSDILSAEVDKVLYLDCDLIVVDSLVPLWELPIEETCELAVVEDSCSANMNYYERLCLPKKYHYFNAGVLLINLEAWRKRGFVAMELLDSRTFQLDYADQDVLNILCAGRVRYLPFRYNIQEPMLRKYMPEMRSEACMEIINELSSPVVVHFTYKLKPWCYTSFHPYKEHFYHYFDQTEWSGERSVPSWKEYVERFLWWCASKVNMVNTYHPLPMRMRIRKWKKEHPYLVLGWEYIENTKVENIQKQ